MFGHMKTEIKRNKTGETNFRDMLATDENCGFSGVVRGTRSYLHISRLWLNIFTLSSPLQFREVELVRFFKGGFDYINI